MKIWADDEQFFAHKGNTAQSTTCGLRKASQVEN
jgi:hypothetical protein